MISKKVIFHIVIFALFLGRLQAQSEAIFKAITDSDTTLLVESLRVDAKLANSPNQEGVSPLMWATFYNKLPELQILLHSGANITGRHFIYIDDAKESYYGNLTCAAAGQGHLAMLQYLVDSLQLPVNEKEIKYGKQIALGWTPLTTASYNGHVEIIDYLLSKGASMAIDSSLSIEVATWNKQHEVINKLVQAGGLYFLVDSFFVANFYKERSQYFINTKQPDSVITYLSRYFRLKERIEYDFDVADCGILNEIWRPFWNRVDIMDEVIKDSNYEYLLVQWPLICEKHSEQIDYIKRANVINRLFEDKLFVRAIDEIRKLKQVIDSNSNVISKNQQNAHLKNLAYWGQRLLDIDSLTVVEEIYTERVIRSKEWIGLDSNWHSFSLNDLGWLYLKLEKHQKALPLLEKSLAIKRMVPDTKEDDLATTLGNLGWAYVENAKYNEAEQAYREAVTIKEKINGDTSKTYLEALSNLGWSMRRAGRNYEAVELLERCLEGYQKITNDTSQYINVISNLAASYFANNRLLEALLLISPVYHSKTFAKNYAVRGTFLWIWQSICVNCDYGEIEQGYLSLIYDLGQANEHFRQLVSMNDLGVMYKRWGKYEEAASQYEKSLLLTESLLGREHTEYATTASNLGWIRILQQKHADAVPLFLNSLEIREKLLPGSWDLAEQYCDVGFLYYSMELPRQSATYYEKGFEVFSKQLNAIFLYTGEDERVALIKKVKDYLDGYLSLAYKYPNEVDSRLMFDASIRLKGWALQSIKDLRQFIFDTGNPEFIKLFEALASTRFSRGEGLLGTKEVSVWELGIEADQLERELLKIEGYSQLLERYQLNTDSIKAFLRHDEVLVDFIHFPLKAQNSCNCEDTIVYAALLMKQDWQKPIFVSLFHESQIALLFADDIPFRGQTYVNNIYQYDESRGSISNAPKQVINIYDITWKPIEQYIPDNSTVWLSLSGYLHRINLAGIQDDKKRFLGERYRIRHILSARSITKQHQYLSSDSIRNILILGALDYNNGVDIPSFAREIMPNDHQHTRTWSAIPPENTSPWNTLKFARDEVNKLHELFKAQSKAVQCYTDEFGTEDVLYEYLNDSIPQILHFSTHGFFYAKPYVLLQDSQLVGNSFQKAWHPLLRSGLVLADANKAWMGDKLAPGKNDGILTAYEVAQLYLPGLELVSLAACDTGLGDLDNGEGVVGLQRSFFKAGTRYIIMSLWNVNDQATQQFMVQFYKNWLINKLTVPQAFQLTQKMYREEYNQSPYFWAGFILVE